jgi:hypothetical protein
MCKLPRAARSPEDTSRKWTDAHAVAGCLGSDFQGYKCHHPNCGQAFESFDGLKTHLKTHEDDWVEQEWGDLDEDAKKKKKKGGNKKDKVCLYTGCSNSPELLCFMQQVYESLQTTKQDGRQAQSKKCCCFFSFIPVGSFCRKKISHL